MATVEERFEKASKKLDDAIKKTEGDVAKYKEIIDRAKYDKLSDRLQVSGISLDDVIDAFSNGDIKVLQDKMNTKKL